MTASSENSLSSPRTLTICTDLVGRQFLVTENQKIVLAFAAAEEPGTVVVSFAGLPLSDQTEIVIESDLWVYVTSRKCESRETIKVAQSAIARVGQAYVFNGAEINSGRPGEPGHITMFYDAPSGGADRIAAGLSLSIHDDGGPGAPTPVNHYTLLSFEWLSIPAPGSTVWVFIASNNMEVGSILDTGLLRSAIAPQPFSGLRRRGSTAIQVGRYLPVDLNVPQQTTIHFDPTVRTFQYGEIAR